MSIWKTIKTPDDLDHAIETSHERPVIIYKHSSRCGTSFIVRKQLEHDWNFDDGGLEIYFLDLIRYRNISDEIARRFGVRHESPQILIICDGESIFDTSHGDVSVKTIKAALGSRSATEAD